MTYPTIHPMPFAASTHKLALLKTKLVNNTVHLPSCIVNIALQNFGRVKRAIDKSQFVLLNPLNVLILVSLELHTEIW